jgi:hypothetical protein
VTARILALLLAVPLAARAGEPFPDDTARALPAGRLETGVFSPLRYGLTDQLELSGHPVLFLVAPNAELKVAWGEPGGVALATVHGLLYPTPMMRLLSREGTGGIVPADVRYPHILATSQHLLTSVGLGRHLVTGRAGGRLATNLTSFDGPRFWSQVEWHFVWPRMAAWFTGWSLDAGLAADGPIGGPFRYRLAVDAFAMPGLRGGHQAWEGTALAEWRPSSRFRLRAGAWFSWAEFPYGSRFLWPPFPYLDAAWAWELGPRQVPADREPLR